MHIFTPKTSNITLQNVYVGSSDDHKTIKTMYNFPHQN